MAASQGTEKGKETLLQFGQMHLSLGIGDVETVLLEGCLDRFVKVAAGVDHIGGRSPGPHFDLDGAGAQLPHFDERRRPFFHPGVGLHHLGDQCPGGGAVVFVANADVQFQLPPALGCGMTQTGS